MLAGAHWTYAAPTLRLKIVALAAVAAGLSAIVATFRQGGAATGREGLEAGSKTPPESVSEDISPAIWNPPLVECLKTDLDAGRRL